MDYYFRKDLRNIDHTVSIDVPHCKNMLCLNESPYDPYQIVQDEFHQIMKRVSLNRYFSEITGQLQEELIKYVGNGVGSQNMILGNGADEMLYYLFTALRDSPEDYILSLSPSYFDYKSYSRAIGMNVKFLDLNPDFDFDLQKYITLTRSRHCRLAILCNPNNPTGNLLDREKILEVINRVEVPVLIDETYFEFSKVTLLEEAMKRDDLLIIRSFSKAFSAAGLRFGYMLGNEKLIREITKVKTAFNSSILVQAFALAILKNKESFLKIVEEISESRDEIYANLKSLPQVKVFPSATNFIPFSFGKRSDELFNFLTDKDIALRQIGAHPLLKNFLRVTAGTKQQNQYFINQVKRWASGNF